jgi:hypothetical protein
MACTGLYLLCDWNCYAVMFTKSICWSKTLNPIRPGNPDYRRQVHKNLKIPCLHSSVTYRMWVTPLLKGKAFLSQPRLGPRGEWGRGIALLFHDRGASRGWVVSSTTSPALGKTRYSLYRRLSRLQGPVWTGGKSRPTGIRSSDRPARIHLLCFQFITLYLTRLNMTSKVWK